MKAELRVGGQGSGDGCDPDRPPLTTEPHPSSSAAVELARRGGKDVSDTHVPFGIGLPIVQQVPAQTQPWEATAGAAELLQVARAADRLGFAWITCSDHIAVPASYAPSMGATWY